MPAVIHYSDWTTGNDWSGKGGADNGGYTGALGAWAPGTNYVTGDRVYYGTAPTRYIWRALRNNRGVTPVEGDDWTLVADGTKEKPFRSITDASSGLAGSNADEVRVAQSPASTAITVNLTWTNGSANVVATGVDITGEIAAKDFLAKATAGGPGDAESPWEVASRAYSGGNTTIVLTTAYIGDTGTVASVKLGVTDTGTAAAPATSVQSLSASGTAGANITVSGGWNLTTGARTGNTWLWQSGANRYGSGLDTNGKSYLTIQHLGFLRYNYGLYAKQSSFVTCSYVTGSGNDYSGLYLNYSSAGAYDHIIVACMVGGQIGVNTYFSNWCTFTDCASRTASTGIYCNLGYFNTFVRCTSSNNALYGFRLVNAPGCRMIGCTASSNGTGVHLTGSAGAVCNGLTAASNGTANVTVVVGSGCGEVPVISLERLNGSTNANYQYFEYGSIARDDVNYNTAAPGVVFTPSSAIYYIRQDLVALGAASTGYTLSIYLKKSAAFNGDVQLEAYNSDGALVTGPTAASVTESWAQYSINIASGDMPAGDTVFLRIRVRGTAGVVYADDFAIA